MLFSFQINFKQDDDKLISEVEFYWKFFAILEVNFTTGTAIFWMRSKNYCPIWKTKQKFRQ